MFLQLVLFKNDWLSGFTSNEEKCRWALMQIGGRLGMIINTVKFQFSIPPRKIENLRVGFKASFISRTGEDSWFFQFTVFGRRPTRPAFLASTIFYNFSERLVVRIFWIEILVNQFKLNGYNIRPKVSVEPLTIDTNASGVRLSATARLFCLFPGYQDTRTLVRRAKR